MSQQENRISDSHFSKWTEGGTTPEGDQEIARLSAVRTLAMDEARAEIARQLNGPLTALLLYMGEIKQHSHQFSQSAGERVYLQQVVQNALQQTERVCAMMKQLADNHPGTAVAPSRKGAWKTRAGPTDDSARGPDVMLASSSSQKPLTRRELEVLNLISDRH